RPDCEEQRGDACRAVASDLPAQAVDDHDGDRVKQQVREGNDPWLDAEEDVMQRQKERQARRPIGIGAGRVVRLSSGKPFRQAGIACAVRDLGSGKHQEIEDAQQDAADDDVCQPPTRRNGSQASSCVAGKSSQFAAEPPGGDCRDRRNHCAEQQVGRKPAPLQQQFQRVKRCAEEGVNGDETVPRPYRAIDPPRKICSLCRQCNYYFSAGSCSRCVKYTIFEKRYQAPAPQFQGQSGILYPWASAASGMIRRRLWPPGTIELSMRPDRLRSLDWIVLLAMGLSIRILLIGLEPYHDERHYAAEA